MEDFSTPQSNKRTANLPNPCPIGLHSHCSILPSSPLLGLCQAIALRQTHTWQDTPPSAIPASSSQTHTMPEYPSLAMPLGPWPPGSPTTSPCQTPAWSQSHSLLGHLPLPPKPTALQALLSPSHAWDHQTLPCSSGPSWLQLHVEQLEACPSGTGTILVQDHLTHQPARNPPPCVELAPALQASQITAPPGSCLAATRGLQVCLRDTHSGLDTKELKTTKPAELVIFFPSIL
jgi:hypothetical protein